jgi:hypothetical protein
MMLVGAAWRLSTERERRKPMASAISLGRRRREPVGLLNILPEATMSGLDVLRSRY